MRFNLQTNTDETTSDLSYKGDITTFGEFKQHVSHLTSIPLVSLQLKVANHIMDYPDHTPLSQTPIWANCQEVTALKVDTGGALFAGGYLVRRVVASDNSCLFTSLSHCLGATHSAQRLRELVCQGILEDPDTYNEAVLEQEIEDYCQWIRDPSSWGGGIEMSIISKMFHTEICLVHINSLQVHRFGEGRYQRRVLLLYTGSHYDYIAYASDPDNPRQFDQTEFAVVDGDGVLDAALKLASSHQQDFIRF